MYYCHLGVSCSPNNTCSEIGVVFSVCDELVNADVFLYRVCHIILERLSSRCDE